MDSEWSAFPLPRPGLEARSSTRWLVDRVRYRLVTAYEDWEIAQTWVQTGGGGVLPRLPCQSHIMGCGLCIDSND